MGDGEPSAVGVGLADAVEEGEEPDSEPVTSAEGSVFETQPARSMAARGRARRGESFFTVCAFVRIGR